MSKSGKDLIQNGEMILSGEVLLDDYAGWMWEEDVYFTPNMVREALAELGEGEQVARINSAGGQVWAGEAIRSIIAGHPGGVRMIVEGIAASSASLLLMGAARREMTAGALLMIHDPSGIVLGTEDDMRAAADGLGVAADTYAAVYAAASGKTADEVRRIMKAETWYSPQGAVEAGFADTVLDMEGDAPAAPAPDEIPAPALVAARAAVDAAANRLRMRLKTSADRAARPGRPTAVGTSPASQSTKEISMSKVPAAQAAQPEPAGTAAETATPAAAPSPAASAPAPAPAPAMTADNPTVMERTRVRRITDAVRAAGLDMSVADHHVDQGSPLEAALDDITMKWKEKGDVDKPMAGRPTASVTGDGRERFVEGAAKALLMKARLDGGERNEFSGLTLSELARESLQMSGERVTFRDRREMIGRALTMAGSHTTSDFAGILANVAGKSVLKGWEEIEESFGLWTRTGTLPDFKISNRVGLGLFQNLPVVPEGADYHYATVGDRSAPIALATYGNLFRITRQAILNDDMSVLSDIPRKMGRAARRTVGSLAYAILTGNPTMPDGVALFHASHGNLAGSGAVLSVASLGAAIAAMKVQKADGQTLNVRPRFLIVPPEQEMLARQLLNSTVDPTATKGMAMNPVANAVELIVDARLTGTAWYLAADPNAYDTVEVAYLDGAEEPFLDEKEGWNSDGVEYKVRIDAGVAPLDYRAFYKNPGA